MESRGCDQNVCKKIIRFSEEMDLHLLRQVLFHQPFDKSGIGWKRVAESLRGIDKLSTVKARRARERTSLLIEQFKRIQNIRESKSDEEEELTEKDHLLLEIIGIKERIENEEKGRESKKKDKDEEQRQRAAARQSQKRIQNKAVAGPSSSSNEIEDDVSSSKKKKPFDLLIELIIRRQEERREERLAELELRKQKLELRRQELALERETFEASRAERSALLLTLKKLAEK